MGFRSAAVAALAAGLAASGVAFAETTPEVFAPGVISGPFGVDSATFSPDGRTVFYDRGVGRDSMIVMSHRTKTGWSKPQIAPFSGAWSDRDPVMAPGGSFLIFCSNRPEKPGGKALDLVTAGGQVRPGQGSHLWRVDRRGASWGEPWPLPAIINDSSRIFSPSVAGDGSVWFQHIDARFHVYHLYRSQLSHGAYQPPVEAAIGPGEADERDPAVSPDERFIVYGANYAAKGDPDRLHIVFRDGDRWGRPIDLGDAINHDGAEGPHLGPDGRTLYFDSSATASVTYPRSKAQARRDLARMTAWDNGDGHIFTVSLAPWLDAHAATRK